MIRLAAEKGKTIVWFEHFVISIPHIHYMEAVYHEPKKGYKELILEDGVKVYQEI